MLAPFEQYLVDCIEQGAAMYIAWVRSAQK